MTSYLKIKQTINIALKDARLLTFDETMRVLEHLQNISEEKELLNKIKAHIAFVIKKSIPHNFLTQRELQILKLIGCNYKSSEISTALTISPNTVATHRKNMIKKLGIKGTRQLKVFANEYVKSETASL